jgi:zinc transporter 9
VSVASGAGLKVVLTAIGGNFLVTIAKSIGWLMTGSSSMLAESIHSAADTANQILILIGIKQSEKKSTSFFPWGHGKARYVWNLVSAMGIFFIGCGVTTYHGVHELMTGGSHDIGDSNVNINLGILGFALLVEGYAFVVAFKETKKQMKGQSFSAFLKVSDDPTTLGVLFEDGVAVFGVMVAFVCVLLAQLLHMPAADAIGSIIIGLLMGFMAIYLAFLNGRLLIGVSSSSRQIKDYKSFLMREPGVEKVISLSSIVVGAGQVVLTVELELCEESLMDRELINEAIKNIRSGEEPGAILIKQTSRMVRVVGAEMMNIERRIVKEYPEIISVGLEVH